LFYSLREEARRAAVAGLIVLTLSRLDAQDNPDRFAPAVAVPRAWALLTSAIEAGALQDQAAAVLALAAAGTPRARAVVEGIARDGSAPARSVAIRSLPNADARYLPLLADALHDGDLEVRRSALDLLGSIRDPRALPLLRGVILDGEDDTIESAIACARHLGPLAFNVLLRAVDAREPRIHEPAIRGIDWILWDGASSRRPDNLEALRHVRPHAILLRALEDDNANVRMFAALILARLGHDGGAHELIRVAAASDQRLGTIISSHYAMAALINLGHLEYLPRLAAALQHPEPQVRMDAALAIQAFPHSSMHSMLIAAIGWDSDVRYHAFLALVAVRGTADSGLLRTGLVDAVPFIRLAAADALLALGPDPDSLEVIEQLTADPRTRFRALTLLSTRGDRSRTASIARSLLPTSREDVDRMRSGHTYDPEYRLAAISVLETMKDHEALPVLGRLFGSDSALNFRVARALAAIAQDHDDVARRLLVSELENPHSTARIHAAGGVISVYDR